MNKCREIQLSIVAGAKAFGQQVVRAACGQGRRIVARVGCPETHVEQRQCKGNKDAEPCEACDPRAALDEAAPPVPEPGFVGRLLAVKECRHVELVDVVTDESKHRRKQRDRGEHRYEDRGSTADGQALDELEAHQQDAEQRDNDDGPGEHHGTSGRRHRARNRRLRVKAFLKALPVPRDHKQRVVDPNADADHRSDLGRELRHTDEVGEQKDQRQADRDTEDRTHQGQAHREQRAEGEEQDQDRCEQPDRFCATRLLLLRDEDDVAAVFDLKSGGLNRVTQADDFVRFRFGDVDGLLREVEVCECDLAVSADLTRAGRRVRARDFLDAGQRSHLGEKRFHLRLDHRVAHSGAGFEDDLGGSAGSRWDPALQDVLHLLRLGAGQREALPVRSL